MMKSSSAVSSKTVYSNNAGGVIMKPTQNKNRLAFAISVVAAGGVLLSGFASAQENRARNSKIEEVIVTAEKREQSLQVVPVAISAFTAEMLDVRGIDTPQELQFAVPGLSIGEQHTGGTAKTTIRGVGNENYQPGGDPGVPIHINGHYTQSSAYIFRDFIDVERVEVQRGPQGTLYGRNAIGGNINIITERPTQNFEGELGFEVGNYGKTKFYAILSGPLSESIRARAVLVDSERDGYVENLGVFSDKDTEDYRSARLSLEADLTNRLKALVTGYFYDDKGNTYSRRFTRDERNIANEDAYKVITNTPDEDNDESTGISVDLTWGNDSIEFRSLSAFDDTLKSSRFDIDSSDILNREYGYRINHETFSQEFQLVSVGDGPLQWVGGLYYYDEESYLKFEIFDLADTNGNGIAPPDDPTDPRFLYFGTSEIDSESMAAYGQVTYALNKNIDLVGGLRYTEDEKSILEYYDFLLEDGSSGSVFGGVFVAPTYGQITRDDPEGDNWSEVTGKLGVNVHVSTDVMAYASYSRGYKSGGYNVSQEDAYDPEYVDAYEMGIKGNYFENQLELNIAAFYYDYADKQDFQRYQIPGSNINTFEVLNASSAENMGVEIEFRAALISNLFVDGSVSYLSAEFEEHESIDVVFPEKGLQDLSGNSLPLSPEWKLYLGAEYQWELTGDLGLLSIRADYQWVDDQYGNAFNREVSDNVIPGGGDLIPSHYRGNVRVSWKSRSNLWIGELYVKNITDETSISNIFVPNANESFAITLPPRTYGFQLKRKF